ncbi:MAG: protein phosphatase 2C domain-containing protein [Streptomyces sp.]|nr:protein phosphatase 2C domain-containing protein [Streptomyces sp.]
MTTTTWLIVLLILSLAANIVLAVSPTGMRRRPSRTTVATSHLGERAPLQAARRDDETVRAAVRDRDQEITRLRALLREAEARASVSASVSADAGRRPAPPPDTGPLRAEMHDLTRQRDEARTTAEQLARRLAEAESRTGAPLGPDSLYPAIPRRLPLGRDAAADSVVDGADLGPVVVRAASVRGDRARHEGRHRRDAFVLRFVEELPTPTLLSVVAAGAPHGRWTQSAADRACRSLAAQVARYGEALGRQLFRPDGSGEEVTALLRTAFQAVGNSMRLVTRGEGPEGAADDAAIEVSLTGLLSRLGDGKRREHVAFGVGDGAVLRLRDGTWTPVFTPAAEPSERSLRMPAAASRVRCAGFETHPGDLIAVCAAPVADLLLRTEAGEWFAARWAGKQPYLTTFLSEVNVPVRSAGGDRTVVCLWDFGDAREARAVAP